jgi:HAE1 family hydrophobic/amphiphilic exporter-1
MAHKNFLPDDDESQFQVLVRAPEGTSLQGTREILDKMAAEIKQLPEMKLVLVTIADDHQQTANLGTLYVRMNEVEDRKDRRVTQYTNMARVRKEIVPHYRGLGLTLSVQKASSFGGGSNAQIQLAVSGPDLAKLTEFSQTALSKVKRIPGVADADSTLYPGKPELQVHVDRQRASDVGASVVDVAQALRLAVAGDDKISAYDEAGEQYEVHVRLDERFRGDAADLSILSVPTDLDGQKSTVRVDQVVKFEQAAGPASIDRYNRQRQFMLRVNLLPGANQSAVTQSINQILSGLNMGPAYQVNPVGQAKEFVRMITNFLVAGALSFVFMYLVIAAQFESFVQAWVIMLTLPLTLPFAELSIILSGDSLNLFSLLGLLVLLGVVKKNAILQVDRANQLRGQGLELVAAMVQASKDRLRPILMTTVAFVAGMVPLTLSRGTGAATNRTAGSVIVFGQILSLALTLLAAPVFYVLLDRFQRWFYRRVLRRAETPYRAPGDFGDHGGR